MTLTADVLTHLAEIGCSASVEGDKLILTGPTDKIPASLLAELRRAKPAIRYALLREKADKIVAFIDGDSPLAKRQEQLSELLSVQERLSAVQSELWAAWRKAGFTVLWSALLEEFVLVGDPPPPPGSEGTVLYSWPEVEALVSAAPERVMEAHRIKKAFTGKIYGRTA